MRASEMRKGQTVKVDGKLYAIVDYQHVKLGKGGAVYQTKLKSLGDGTIQNVRLRSEEWTVLIRDAFPGYISWERYEVNLTVLAANAPRREEKDGPGPVRSGGVPKSAGKIRAFAGS